MFGSSPPPPPSERAGTYSHILKNAFLPLVFLSFSYKTIKNLILYTIGRPLATVHPFACFFITFPPVRALSANPLSEATFAKRCTLKRDIGRDTARMIFRPTQKAGSDDEGTHIEKKNADSPAHEQRTHKKMRGDENQRATHQRLNCTAPRARALFEI